MTEQTPRDRCRLPAPSWCDGGRALSGALLPGAQAARQSCKAAPPVRVLRASTRTTAHNTHDLAPREKAPPRRQEYTRHHLDDKNTPGTTSTNPNAHEEDHQKTTTKPSPHDDDDLASCAPLYPPVPTPHSFQLLREASRKGACPLDPLPARRAGAEKIILGPGPRRFIPPKRDPSFTGPLTFDPHRPSPTPKRGEKQAGIIRRENQAGKSAHHRNSSGFFRFVETVLNERRGL